MVGGAFSPSLDLKRFFEVSDEPDDERERPIQGPGDLLPRQQELGACGQVTACHASKRSPRM